MTPTNNVHDIREFIQPNVPPIDDAAAAEEAVRAKMGDISTPGYKVEFDPSEADRAGAFSEDALSELDAAASSEDLAANGAQIEPAFLDDEGPSQEIPTFITTRNAIGLFGLKPGETVPAAIARYQAKAD